MIFDTSVSGPSAPTIAVIHCNHCDKKCHTDTESFKKHPSLKGKKEMNSRELYYKLEDRAQLRQ
jgi:hypothetical protein